MEQNQNNTNKDKSNTHKQNKRGLKTFARLSGVAFQMGATFYLAVFLGKKVDAYFGHEKKIVTLIFVILAMVASIFSILAQLKKIQK